ncbi:MAG: acyl-CoA dehydrogenase family protein [bacterium]
MDFGLTPEQKAIRDTAMRFATTRLLPGYQEREKADRIDRELVKEFGALGMLGTTLPEELGGAGLDFVTTGIIAEAISYGDHGLGYLPLLSTLVGEIIRRSASEAVAREWLPRICTGEVLPCLALTEPEAGSDAAHIKLRAERRGDTFVFNGEKTSISLAAWADMAVVFGRSDPESPGAHGISAFVVPLDLPGISRTVFNDLGTRVIGRGSIFFEDVEVPASNLLGQEGRGFRQVMAGFDFNRALIGMQCVGTAQASVDETWTYVVERKAFGSPLVKFEGVSFPLAEQETLLEAARLLCLKTLWLKDAGEPHTAEAAMCKWWAPKVSFDAITECLLLHGHAGYSEDFPHQQRMRDVLGLQIGDGTAQIMKLIIAREKVGRVAVPY